MIRDLVWERVLRLVFGISFDLVALGCDIDDLATGGGMLSDDIVSSGKVSINLGLLRGGNILLESPNILLLVFPVVCGRLFEGPGRNTSSLFEKEIHKYEFNLFSFQFDTGIVPISRNTYFSNKVEVSSNSLTPDLKLFGLKGGIIIEESSNFELLAGIFEVSSNVGIVSIDFWLNGGSLLGRMDW